MEREEFFPTFRPIVCTLGYQWGIGWRNGTGAEIRFLHGCPTPPGQRLMLVREYDIRDFSSLFLRFARTPPTEEGILGFANTYGTLGARELIWPSAESQQRYGDGVLRGQGTVRSPWDGEFGPFFFGEAYETWHREILAMRSGWDLWEGIRAEDQRWFLDHTNIAVQVEPGEVMRVWADYSLKDDDGVSLASVDRKPLTLPEKRSREPLSSEDVIRALTPSVVAGLGWAFLQEILNSRLEMYTASRLFQDDRQGRLRLHVVPTNLLGALWLQFARGIDGDITYSPCRECGNVLEISVKEGYRTNRAYCSDACRSKAYRDRQMKTHQLAAQGLAVEEIAATLGTTLERAKRWLAKVIPPSAISTGTRRRGRPRKTTHVAQTL